MKKRNVKTDIWGETPWQAFWRRYGWYVTFGLLGLFIFLFVASIVIIVLNTNCEWVPVVANAYQYHCIIHVPILGCVLLLVDFVIGIMGGISAMISYSI